MKAKSNIEALRAAHARYLTEDGATYAVLSAELGIAVSALHRRWERLAQLAAELDLDPSALRRRWRSLRLSPADALAGWRSARDAR